MHPPKVPLILKPTPLHRLDRISAELGIDLWIKRDDLTGFALGGNKGRKLEYLIADAADARADLVVTCGAAQSNFIRQLGAACSMVGMRCAASVMHNPFEESEPEGAVDKLGANLTLDYWLGVELDVHPNGTWEELYQAAENLAQSHEKQGLRVYRIPIGGSSPLGALGFVDAAHELWAQTTEPFDWIIFASSSGSTHTGLLHAHRQAKDGWESTKILGIACDPEPEIAGDFAILADQLDQLLGTQVGLRADDFDLEFDFVGPGYGVSSEAGQAAIRHLAQREGIFLDPVYSGKAFAALLGLAAVKKVYGRVLFWHTGGTPALFTELKETGT